MDSRTTIQWIVEGMERYFRAFTLADNIQHHTGDFEWIAPLTGTPGPAIVFKVSLEEATASQRIDEIIPDLKAGNIPSFWVVPPTSTPANVVDLLVKKGFNDLTGAVYTEPGMAVEIEAIPPLSLSNPGIVVKKVQTLSEFGTWTNIVNEALHGWELLTSQHYAAWLACEEFGFYQGTIEGKPIATVATMQTGDTASIEFVSTLSAYRRQGAAFTTNLVALHGLQQTGVRLVTLRSSKEAIPLYSQLGFQPYYEQVLLSYPRT
jgi:hypothetical protein